jgi:hypothetical protein
MSLDPIDYPTKVNLNIVVDQQRQATAEDFNQIKLKYNTLLSDYKIQKGVNLANEKEIEIQSLSSNGKVNAIVKDGGQIKIHRHLGADNWLEITLGNSGSFDTDVLSAYKVVSQRVYKMFGYILANDASQSGTWQSWTSNSATQYVGHKSLRSFNPGDQLSFTKTFGGNLSLVYVADTDGGMVEISINGETPIIVDTYSETSNLYNQKQNIYTDLPYGTHTVTITVLSDSNSNSSGTQVWFNALEVSGDIFLDDPLVYPKKWESGTAYLQFDEVIGQDGNIYIAQQDGTSGNTIPAHSSGSVSDGVIDWLYSSASSFVSESFRIQAIGSELEYAYEVVPLDEDIVEDIGGNLHGNEYIDTMSYYVDGKKIELVEGVYYKGKSITVEQNLVQFYGDYQNRLEIANVKQIHAFSLECMSVRYSIDLIYQCNIGYYYTAMFPFLAYDGANQRIQFKELSSPQASVKLLDYDGVSGNPILGKEKDFIAYAVGNAFVPRGSGGVPSTEPAKEKVTIALRVNSETMDNYTESEMNCGLAVNTNGNSFTGYSSILSKIYFQRIRSGQSVVFQPGDKLQGFNKYYIKIHK